MREVGEIEGAYQAAMAEVEMLGPSPFLPRLSSARLTSFARLQVLKERSRSR